MNLRLLTPIFLLTMLIVGSAAAADDQRTRAGQFFRAGQAAFSQGDFAAAAQSFEQAHQLLPSGSTLYNAARAWDQGAEPGLAAASYEEALAQVDLSAAQRKHAQTRLKELQRNLLAVRIEGPRDFVVLDAAGGARALPTKIYVAPDTKQVTLRDAQQAPQALAITGQAGETITKTVASVPASVASTPQPERAPPQESLPMSSPPVAPAPAQRPLYWGWVGAGLATVAATATTIVGLSFLFKRNDFIEGGRTNAALREDAVRLGTLTGVGMGVTLVGAGVALWGFHRRGQPSQSDIAFTLAPQGFSMGGRF